MKVECKRANRFGSCSSCKQLVSGVSMVTMCACSVTQKSIAQHYIGCIIKAHFQIVWQRHQSLHYYNISTSNGWYIPHEMGRRETGHFTNPLCHAKCLVCHQFISAVANMETASRPVLVHVKYVSASLSAILSPSSADLYVHLLLECFLRKWINVGWTNQIFMQSLKFLIFVCHLEQ